MAVKITGFGCYIPEIVRTNEDFLNHKFYTETGKDFDDNPQVIIKKFEQITGIKERRYVSDDLNVSDIALIAAQKAINDAKIDPETLDYIIVAHNFGDVKHGTTQTDILPSIGSRVKRFLKIKNHRTVAYDIIFGCPGWLQGSIQAKAFIESGLAKRCLVIGAETLSRVVDPHDRDSMIYSDGAGATIYEKSDDDSGILSHESATFTEKESHYIYFGETNNKSNVSDRTGYIKMYGRKIYNFALSNVPKAMKSCFDQSGKDIKQLKKIFIHQANEKMDEAIVQRFYKLYGLEMPDKIMPMSIDKLGNSSVATIPTLYDLFLKGHFKNQTLEKGDIIMFASVGAGMNINALTYQI
ncbi:3-oxoacyl-ACP synthase III family protein [Psychroflexus sp. MBR-150]|jgi:3-oxoacyl-[acyl-carrier-protein] synthase-3